MKRAPIFHIINAKDGKECAWSDLGKKVAADPRFGFINTNPAKQPGRKAWEYTAADVKPPDGVPEPWAPKIQASWYLPNPEKTDEVKKLTAFVKLMTGLAENPAIPYVTVDEINGKCAKTLNKAIPYILRNLKETEKERNLAPGALTGRLFFWIVAGRNVAYQGLNKRHGGILDKLISGGFGMIPEVYIRQSDACRSCDPAGYIDRIYKQTAGWIAGRQKAFGRKNPVSVGIAPTRGSKVVSVVRGRKRKLENYLDGIKPNVFDSFVHDRLAGKRPAGWGKGLSTWKWQFQAQCDANIAQNFVRDFEHSSLQGKSGARLKGDFCSNNCGRAGDGTSGGGETIRP